MSYSPSLLLIEERLFELLSFQFPSATVLPTHPSKRVDLDQGDFLIIINYVSDSIEGSIITPLVLHPRFSFTVYALNYPKARFFSEEIINFLDQVSSLDFDWTDQKIDVVHRLSRSPVSFDSDSYLYLISVDYRFIISSC